MCQPRKIEELAKTSGIGGVLSFCLFVGVDQTPGMLSRFCRQKDRKKSLDKPSAEYLQVYPVPSGHILPTFACTHLFSLFSRTWSWRMLMMSWRICCFCCRTCGQEQEQREKSPQVCSGLDFRRSFFFLSDVRSFLSVGETPPVSATSAAVGLKYPRCNAKRF